MTKNRLAIEYVKNVGNKTHVEFEVFKDLKSFKNFLHNFPAGIKITLYSVAGSANITKRIGDYSVSTVLQKIKSME